MSVAVGTSGFSFKEWKGPFYPPDLKNDAMLGYYAERFPTVEINNTFYRLPREHVLAEWGAQVPDGFTFSFKASQRITHYGRIRADNVKTAVGYLLSSTATLGSKLGPILFQLPPDMPKDVERLRDFLALLPADRRFTFEFRHDSWFDDAVYEVLRAHDVALCAAESEEYASACVATATWGYLRLHRQDYNDAMLAEWQARVAEFGWKDAYVFFKHDYIDGSGPLAVERFSAMIHGAAGGVNGADAVLPRVSSRAERGI